jgi:hypothetical protein
MEEYDEELKDWIKMSTRGMKDWSMRETRWHIMIEGKSITGEYPAISSLSKFFDNKATISYEEIEREWASWDEIERQDFLFAYMRGHIMNEEDFRIIEFIMEHAGPCEVCVLPQLVSLLPDKKRVLRYLLERIDEANPEEIASGASMSMGNFYMQIENMGESEAIPVLKKKISKMLEYLGLHEEGHHIQGVHSREVAIDLIWALRALCSLEPRDDYRKLLEGFKQHPNEDIARSATSAMRELYSGE